MAAWGRARPVVRSRFVPAAGAVIVFAGATAAIGTALAHGSGPAKKTLVSESAQSEALGAGSPLAPGEGITNFKVSSNGKHARTPASRARTAVPGVKSLPGSRVPSGAVAAVPRDPAARKSTSQGSPVQSAGAGTTAPSSPQSAATESTPAQSTPPTTPEPAPTTQQAAPAPTQSASTEAAGQVSCSSGAPVEGVWIATVSGSNWASWQPVGSGSTANYSLTLPASESYAVHVGCGGSTAQWAVTVSSGPVSPGSNSFNCIDNAGAADSCEPA
jgi:hypothetical protein